MLGLAIALLKFCSDGVRVQEFNGSVVWGYQYVGAMEWYGVGTAMVDV